MQSSSLPSSESRLQWQEPRGFRKPGLKDSRKSTFRIIALTAAATLVFIGIAYWLDFDLGAEMTWSLLIAAGGIVILCLIVLAGAHLVPFTVKITDKAVVVEDQGDTPTIYRFRSVDHCEIGNASVGTTTVSVLVVALKNGCREIFGVDPLVSTAVLRAALEHRGVRVVTRTDTIDEQVLSGEKDDPCSRIEHSSPEPFQSLVHCLKKDGLLDQANRFDELLNHTAWTTGAEILGELGMEMKRIWPMVKARGSSETKENFKSAARLVRMSWPRFRL